MKIFDQDVQLVLQEVQQKLNGATYIRTALGGHQKFVSVNGDLLKEELLEKVPREYVEIRGGKTKWWQSNGAEAREVARSLHLRGPNIKDVAPLLTPESVVVHTYYTYPYESLYELREYVEDILQFLTEEEYIKGEENFGYTITGKGMAHLFKGNIPK